MKRDVRKNLVILTLCLLTTVLLGGYITYVRQPVELEQVKKAEQLMRLNKAETASRTMDARSGSMKLSVFPEPVPVVTMAGCPSRERSSMAT